MEGSLTALDGLQSGSISNSKSLGLTSATSLVVANMIGAGVFTTSGFALQELGASDWVLLAWLCGGVIALAGAYSYGQLASRLTQSGGEYLYLSRMVHPVAGFVVGWVSLLAGFTGSLAFAAISLELYLIPSSVRPDWLPTNLIAMSVILLFAALNSGFALRGIRTMNSIVVLKIALLVGFLVFAFFTLVSGRWEGLAQFSSPPFRAAPSIGTFAQSLVWISLSFSGFNAAIYVSGEVKKAAVTVPRAMLLGTKIAIVLYLLLNFTFLFAPRAEMIEGYGDVAVIASQALGGEIFAGIVRAIISIALLSSISSLTLAGPRVYAQMASDGLFPEFFRLSQGTPTAAVWLQSLLACALIQFSSLIELLGYLGFTLSISSALTVLSLFLSECRAKVSSRPTLTLMVSAFYVLATITVGALSLYMKREPEPLYAFFLVIGSGFIIYLLRHYLSAWALLGRGR